MKIQRIANSLVVVLISGFLLIYLGTILKPIAFAVLFSLLLTPLCNFFEKRLHRIVSISLSLFLVVGLVGGVLFFFGNRIYTEMDGITHLLNSIKKLITNILININQLFSEYNLPIIENAIHEEGSNSKLFDISNFINKTITSSFSFISGIFMVIIYTFLFLLYRDSFKKIILLNLTDEKRENASETLKKIQKVIKSYFKGLFFIILIVGTLNSLGLWLFGLEYPILFGFLGALLSIIPYIGTAIGGLIPVSYAIVVQDKPLLGLLIIGWYLIVQFLEGNFLTPKIVGSQVSINPLFAILSIVLGSIIWGISGAVLFLPFTAVLKVILDHITSTERYGFLLSSDFGDKKSFSIKGFIKKNLHKHKHKH